MKDIKLRLHRQIQRYQCHLSPDNLALKIFNRKTLDPLTLSSIFNFEQKSIHYPDFQIFKPYFKTDPFIKILGSMSHIFLAEPLSRSIHVTQQPEPASGLAFMRALQHPLDTVP